MSNSQISNENTDGTINEQNNVESITIDQQINEPQINEPQIRTSYEVVFFAKYNKNPRPTLEQMTNFFNGYGTVHHINYPTDRNYAFIFMTKLSTNAEHRRTRTTIGQIIHDMTPETQFRITVASSNRRPNATHSQRGYINMHRNFASNTVDKYNNRRYPAKYKSYDKYNYNNKNNFNDLNNNHETGQNNQSFRPRRSLQRNINGFSQENRNQYSNGSYQISKPKYQNRGNYARPVDNYDLIQS